MCDSPALPQLGEPYAQALEEAVAYLQARYEVQAIVASGSIVRGNPDPASDLDVVALHDAPYRQRLQRFFNGIPAELFVNSPGWVRRAFESERQRGRPSLAHMLATGMVIYDRGGAGAAFQAEAAAVLAAGPSLTADELILVRYGAATTFEDAADLAGRAPALCRLALHRAVEQALRYRYLASNRWEPRFKELLADLGELDPVLPALADAFFAARELEEQLRAAELLVAACVGETGFFEWESPPQAE
jgi:hypothetical protein